MNMRLMLHVPRRAIALTSVLSAGALALALIGVSTSAFAAPRHEVSADSSTGLPVKHIESIMQSDGNVSGKVLEVDQNRSDIKHVTGGAPAVPFKVGFQLQNEFYFQSIGHGKAALNGDLALKPSEIQPVIDAILANGLTFQAEHQHLYDLSPMVWFVHLRGFGDPLALARAAHNVVKVTSTPLPQSSPAHPTTPLPASQLGKILGGDVTIGENGVVTVSVPREHSVVLGGVRIDPDLGVANTIQFEPLGNGKAAVVPDFSMTAPEVMQVTKIMRGMQWEVGCLYNQETDEQPQLYFSHMFKTGDPIELAKQVRAGLDHSTK
jgi:hypothetical protein